MLKPRMSVPDLEIQTVSGEMWKLSERRPDNFTMIVFYRGLHCPICSRYLGDLNRKADRFAEKGVDVLVASSDDAGRAQQAKDDWGLDSLTVAFGLSIDEARRWGLHVSAGIGKTSAGVEEPGLFSEPGIFLIRPDGTLYFSTVQTMPFARPGFAEILQAIDFVIERGYPARGEA